MALRCELIFTGDGIFEGVGFLGVSLDCLCVSSLAVSSILKVSDIVRLLRALVPIIGDTLELGDIILEGGSEQRSRLKGLQA